MIFIVPLLLLVFILLGILKLAGYGIAWFWVILPLILSVVVIALALVAGAVAERKNSRN